MTSILREEGEETAGAIKYIKLSEYHDKFYEWKENPKTIYRHKGILKYLTKEAEIPTEEENDDNKMKIYEEYSKAWDFLIIRLIYI